MPSPNRVLLAIDESEASRRALRYVCAIALPNADMQVVLCHVVSPLPPDPLESPGAEDAEEERELTEELRAAQADWSTHRSGWGERLLERARAFLTRAGVPPPRVELRLVDPGDSHGGKLVEHLLEEADGARCRTIVVGRSAFSRLKELVRTHVADDLVRRSQGYTVWVVE
jgi:nucleotide-binding universal stress UspA family protein